MATASQVSSWLLVEVNGPWGQRRHRPERARTARPAGVAPGHEAPGASGCSPSAATCAATSSTSATGCTLVHVQAPRPGVREAVASRRVIGDLHEVVSATAGAGRRPRARRRAGSPTTAATCSCARTAATTPAAPRTAGRWCGRCASRGGPTRSGSARTSAATASPATSCCCPTASTSGTATGRQAERVLAAHDDGRLDLANFRGRSTFRMPEQAAEQFVRVELGLDALDAVRSVEALDDGRHRVTVAGADGPADVRRDARAGGRAGADAVDVQGRRGRQLPVVPPRRPRRRVGQPQRRRARRARAAAFRDGLP